MQKADLFIGTLVCKGVFYIIFLCCYCDILKEFLISDWLTANCEMVTCENVSKMKKVVVQGWKKYASTAAGNSFEGRFAIENLKEILTPMYMSHHGRNNIWLTDIIP
jgi:hypothetical protein